MSYKFYGWENADIAPVSEKYKKIKDPKMLYDMLCGIWSIESCAPRLRGEWSKENKTLGQCSITAFLVQDIFGGCVYGIKRPGGSVHCFNRASDITFDLTSEQFGGEELNFEECILQSRDEHFKDKDKEARYEYLKEGIEKCLEDIKDSSGKKLWKAGNMLYPAPAVMVSCAGKNRSANIITIAWTGTINSDPPMLSISVRPERYSYEMIKETGEFVVNLTTEKLVKAADFCGVRSGRDIDKFKETSLTAIKASFLEYAPLIQESPVNIECRVKDIIPLGSHDMFLAEILGVDTDGEYMDEKGRFDLERAGLIAYSHGEYFALGEKLGKFGFSVRKKK